MEHYRKCVLLHVQKTAALQPNVYLNEENRDTNKERSAFCRAVNCQGHLQTLLSVSVGTVRHFVFSIEHVPYTVGAAVGHDS